MANDIPLVTIEIDLLSFIFSNPSCSISLRGVSETKIELKRASHLSIYNSPKMKIPKKKANDNVIRRVKCMLGFFSIYGFM